MTYFSVVHFCVQGIGCAYV